MLEKKTERPVGILHLADSTAMNGLQRFLPSSDLAEFVEHYWAVEWETNTTIVRETIPHPSVHMVIEPQRSMVHGVHTQRFTRVLEGNGRALGTKFLPGGFRTFLGNSVSSISDKVLAVAEIFGPKACELESQALACTQAMDSFLHVESFLREMLPQPCEEMIIARKACARIAKDRSITRVEQLLDPLGINLRKLQRLFQEFVGVSPKWVIRRYRLLDAAERLKCEQEVMDFASLALELGYADQAHFIRDFKGLVGHTPASYRKSLQNL